MGRDPKLGREAKNLGREFILESQKNYRLQHLHRVISLVYGVKESRQSDND